MNKKLMFLVPGMVLGAIVMAADPQPSSDNLTFRVNIGRQELLLRSDTTIREANRKADEREFDAAIKKYREIIDFLKPFETGREFSRRIEFCRKRIQDCYLHKAEDAMARADEQAMSKDFEAAISTCREAQKFCPEKKDELAEKIEFYEKRRAAALEREGSSVDKLLPNRNVQDYNIQLLLEQGRTLVGRNELTAARRKFEEVLLIDPFNSEAIQNLEGVNNLIRKDAKIRASATARRMIAKVEFDGTIPIAPDAPVGEPKNQLDAPVKKVAESGLMKKLRTIRIPRLNVEEGDRTFSELMKEISTYSRRYDRSTEGARGVNFIVRTAPVKDGQDEPKINSRISIQDRSLLDLLNYLQNNNLLTFKVADDAVFVAQAGVPLEDMEVRFFSYALKKDDKPESLKAQFEAEGVAFGEGSDVKIVRARNQVVVRNTPENLKKVDMILQQMRDKDPMIQVMFKFIEVSQNDLDELGFNWAYSRFNNDYTTVVMNSNELLRHYSPDNNDRYEGSPDVGKRYNVTSRVKTEAQKPTEDSDATYQFMWYDRKNFFSASVYALDWADSKDLLYSPRVTTLSGTTAKIDMTETHYYPKDWENIDSESNNDFRIEVPTPQPDLSDEQKLGVTFEIKPEANGKLIKVPINIPIQQFAGWMVVDTRSGGDDDDGEYIKKPIFTQRTIKTSVTVKDGETVLIGGVSQDLSQSIDDKIPILGDIPFIGRFFQSKYMNSQKNYLLVFMTCRIVKPDGSPFYPKERNPQAPYPQGSPEFSKNM